jgi:ATP dependent DNA ligase domain
MPEICLQAARIVAGIGQGIASAMAQHVRNVAAYPPRPGSSRRAFRQPNTTLPSGSQWLHEIRHDGFRIIARKIDGRVRLYSRPGHDLTRRFPLIVEALRRLRSRSCFIDGEAVVVATTASRRSTVSATDVMWRREPLPRIVVLSLSARIPEFACEFDDLHRCRNVRAGTSLQMSPPGGRPS